MHAPGLWPSASLALRRLHRLPGAAIGLWATHPLGHIVIDPREVARYESGRLQWRDLDSRAVLVLTPDVVQEDARRFWEIVGAWLDHWLGSDGAAHGAWLSEGGSPTQPQRLLEAAVALQAILDRGYAHVLLGTDEPRTLFARAVSLALTDPRALSTADPHLARWLRGTLLNEGWWGRLAPQL